MIKCKLFKICLPNISKYYRLMINNVLHDNQKEADVTTINDFQSGVYFHATGTGKSRGYL